MHLHKIICAIILFFAHASHPMQLLKKAFKQHSFNNLDKWIERAEKELKQDSFEKLQITCQLVADECANHYIYPDEQKSFSCKKLFPAIEKIALQTQSPQAAHLLLDLMLCHRRNATGQEYYHPLDVQLARHLLNLASTHQDEELLERVVEMVQRSPFRELAELCAQYRWSTQATISLHKRYNEFLSNVLIVKNEPALLDILTTKPYSRIDKEKIRLIATNVNTPAVSAQLSEDMSIDQKNSLLWHATDLESIYFLLKIGANKYVDIIEKSDSLKSQTIVHKAINLNPQPYELQQIMTLPSFDIHSWPPANLPESRKRIVTLLCCLKQKAKEWQSSALYVPDIIKLIVAYCYDGFTGKKMAEATLPFMHEDDLSHMVTRYPNDWFKSVPSRLRSRTLDLLTDQRLTYLKMLCGSEDAAGKIPSDYAPNQALKNLLTPAHQHNLLYAQVRDQIAKELEYH